MKLLKKREGGHFQLSLSKLAMLSNYTLKLDRNKILLQTKNYCHFLAIQ